MKSEEGDGRDDMEEHVTKTESIVIERKTFVVERRRNTRGDFLKVREEKAGRTNIIIVPLTGLERFVNALQSAAQG